MRSCAGNLLALALSPLLLANFGWRVLFYIFGLLGAPLLALWMYVVPAHQQRLQQQGGGAPPAAGGSSSSSSSSSGVSAWQLMGSTATWAIIVANIVNHWGYFIYLNWMPTYFNKAGQGKGGT